MRVFADNTIYLTAALVCAGIGAVWDIRTRRIPNKLTGPALVVGLLLHLYVGGWRSMLSAALAGLIGGVVFLIFHLAGGMGAGDVKLIVAVLTIAGIHFVPQILLATALSGGIFAVVLAIWHGQLRSTLANIGVLFTHHRMHGMAPHDELNVSNPATLRLPYGIAIAAGTAVCLVSFGAGTQP